MSSIENEDTKYAQKVCEGEKTSRQKFILKFSDHAMWVAKKWHRNIESNEEYYIYKTISGSTIQLTDEITNTWTWLLKKIVESSCNFKGKNNAKLDTFIFSILNGHFTFNDWLKNKYGNTEYLPKVVKKLSKDHQKVFTMLKRKLNSNAIASKLDMELSEVEYLIHELKSILFKEGKSNLLADKNIFVEKYSSSNQDEDYDLVESHEDSSQIDSDRKIDFEKIYKILKQHFTKMDKTDRRLLKLYWTGQLSVSQIILFIKKKNKLMASQNWILKKITTYMHT